MIKRNRFFEIKEEVEVAVMGLFNYAQAHSNNYVLLLADAEYNDSYIGIGHSPYVLSSKVDYYKESSRLEFSQFFLNKLYTFGPEVKQSKDNPFWLQLEMMIYCHIWESNKFLKQLFRIQNLVRGKSYPWQVVIPESSKHSFIRNTIRDGFSEMGLPIAEVIKKGFHTSLRNSFLHTEFEIEETAVNVKLHTHRVGRKQFHELDNISFNDWTERFLYSVFLNYFFIKEKEKRRRNVKKDFGTDEFLVAYPLSSNRFKTRTIYYDESREDFHPTRSEPYVPGIRATVGTDTIQPVNSLTAHTTQQDLENIEQLTGSAVVELLRALHAENEDLFICWLCDVSYDKAANAYVSRPQEDTSRLTFSATLLDVIYKRQTVSLPNLILIQMEMMIYAHIWESKPLLKQLRAAARIISGEFVNWSEELEADRRLLLDDIIKKFEAKNCHIAALIKEGFHTSLRNAFAHSEYEIAERHAEIYLDTYKEEHAPWDIRSISFSDWKRKFLLSISLDYQLILARKDLRKNISDDDLEQILDKLNKELVLP